MNKHMSYWYCLGNGTFYGNSRFSGAGRGMNYNYIYTGNGIFIYNIGNGVYNHYQGCGICHDNKLPDGYPYDVLVI